jgi:hypothetical protein
MAEIPKCLCPDLEKFYIQSMIMKLYQYPDFIHQPAWFKDKYIHKHLIVFRKLWHGFPHIFKISEPINHARELANFKLIILARLFTYLTNKRAKMAHYIRKISGPSHGRLTPSYTHKL